MDQCRAAEASQKVSIGSDSRTCPGTLNAERDNVDHRVAMWTVVGTYMATSLTIIEGVLAIRLVELAAVGGWVGPKVL